MVRSVSYLLHYSHSRGLLSSGMIGVIQELLQEVQSTGIKERWWLYFIAGVSRINEFVK